MFVARLVVVTGIEWIRPARQVDCRKLLGRDILLIAMYWFGMVPIAEYIERLIAVRPNVPAVILQFPLWVRVLGYLVIADFGHYWIHRFVHHKYVWRIHKWHHSPTGIGEEVPPLRLVLGV